MRQRFGPILVSGPTNIAVDNFAERIELIGRRVCDRHNAYCSSSSTLRRPLVVRGYHINDEYLAFERLLQKPDTKAEPIKSGLSPWKLPNSMTFWLAVCIDSVAAKELRELHPNDAEALHKLRAELQQPMYQPLRDVATGRIAWGVTLPVATSSAKPSALSSPSSWSCVPISSA